MFRSTLLILGVAIFGTSSVNCVGTAFIENRCNSEVYVWSVANLPNSTVNYLAPTIGGFNETYRTNPNGGGVSLKIATTQDDSVITQFEYTYHISNPNVYYDISNVNGYPFEEWGLALSPSAPNCPSVSCDPGVPICADVYNQPHDDWATKNCDVSANLTLTLCPAQRTTSTSTFTSTTTVTATVMTTDSEGSTFLTTLTSVINPVEPTTILQ